MNDRGEGEDRSANKPALLNKEEALELLDRVPYIRTFKAPNNKALLGFPARCSGSGAGHAGCGYGGVYSAILGEI